MPRETIADKYSTWLVIPYFDGDTGIPGRDRPLSVAAFPGKPEYYLCPSMRVNGGPLRKFVPDEPTTLEVTVANLGGGTNSALTTVTVWWADPGAAFKNPKLFGQAVIPVPSKGRTATANLVGTIPGDAPKHVCLLAVATAPGDPATKGVGVAPGSDRHWAQLNLDAVVPDADGQFIKEFSVANTGRHQQTFLVTAAEPSRESVGALSEVLDLDLSGDASLIWRMASSGGESTEGTEPLRIVLEAGQTEQITLQGRILSPLEPGTGRIIEVRQHSPAGADFDVRGALGIVLVAEET